MRAGDHLSGRYRLDVRLGHGGMGEVWRAFDTELGRPVAVKVLLQFHATHEELQRFRREASIGARLKHPGITVVYDVGQHENRQFIVMELLEGMDLSQLLARSPGGLPVAEAVGLALQTAEALAAAHGGKVVHRDLKPGNLFLQDDGRIKICDFGIARAADTTGSITVTDRLIGTPAYMAPEQWRGEYVDAKCDQYALGCVLHALLAGTPPFPASEQPWVLMHRHLEETPPALHTLRNDVPAEIAELVTALLAKHPDARPDAASTAQRLHSIQRHAPGPHSTSTRDATPPSRGPAPASEDPATPVTATAPNHDTAPAPTQPIVSPPAPAALRHRPRRRTLILGSLATASAGTLAALGLTLADSAGTPKKGGSPSPGPSRHPASSPGSPVTLGGGGNAVVRSVAFSPDGNTLASADDDGEARLWNVATKTLAKTFTHKPVNPWPKSLAQVTAFNPAFSTALSVAFSPDGARLAVGNGDGTVSVWNVATGAETTLPYLDPVEWNGSVAYVAFHPSGGMLAASYDAPAFRLWNLSTRTAGTPLTTGDTSWISTLAFSPSGTVLATSSGNGNPGNTTSDGRLQLWDVPSRSNIATLARTNSTLHSLAFSSDGKRLANLRSDGTLTLWDVAARRSTATLAGPGSEITCIAPGPGTLLASGTKDGAVNVWNTANSGSTAAVTTDTTSNCIAFSPDGKTLASGGTNLTMWTMT
ncbi:protein kinase [Streptomyces sp. NPDC048665]|uniref:WD40 repeat domain-containing serine/threonine protein kinase n=1 Tax=Streptomyces sp. NPDC048665 TaxID=3155490 RepID=UPI003418AAE7